MLDFQKRRKTITMRLNIYIKLKLNPGSIHDTLSFHLDSEDARTMERSVMPGRWPGGHTDADQLALVAKMQVRTMSRRSYTCQRHPQKPRCPEACPR